MIMRTMRTLLIDQNAQPFFYQAIGDYQVGAARSTLGKRFRVGDLAGIVLKLYGALPFAPEDNSGMARELPRQIFGQALVQQDAHLDAGEQAFAGLFAKGDGELARDGGVLFQEFIERVTALDLIPQGSHGHAGAGEARFAADDFRVKPHDGIVLHGVNEPEFGRLLASERVGSTLRRDEHTYFWSHGPQGR